MKANWTVLAALMTIVLAGALCGCEEQTKASGGAVEPVAEPTATQVQEPSTATTPEATAAAGETATARRARLAREAASVPVEAAKGPAPKLVFDSLMADFGDVGPGMRKTIDITFKNEGKGPLNVTRVDGCCGC